jgi:hypothetical protein
MTVSGTSTPHASLTLLLGGGLTVVGKHHQL